MFLDWMLRVLVIFCTFFGIYFPITSNADVSVVSLELVNDTNKTMYCRQTTVKGTYYKCNNSFTMKPKKGGNYRFYTMRLPYSFVEPSCPLNSKLVFGCGWNKNCLKNISECYGRFKFYGKLYFDKSDICRWTVGLDKKNEFFHFQSGTKCPEN